jgi:hypothetical protein
MVMLAEPEESVIVRIDEISGNHLVIATNTMVPSGAPLKIELDDCILLGEVYRCESEGNCFKVGVELKQALTAVTDLAKLVARVMGEAMPEQKKQELRARLM